MPLCELARMVKLIEHLLEDITMIVVTQEGTSGEISVDEALVTTIAAI
jgi:hypothetical protein